MKFPSLYRVELGRTLHDRLTWLLAALTALAPLAGYSFFAPTIGDSMSAMYLANPMLTGGLAGTLLFAVLMLVSLDKSLRSRIGDITDAIISPLSLCAARLLAVLTAAVITAAAVGVFYLPYTIYKLDIVFSLSDYVLAVALFFLSGPVMGTLAVAALWQLVRRLDISLLAVLAVLFFSKGQWCGQYFLAQWSVPLVSTLSDAFGSAIVWRTALYSRVVWLCTLGGAWLFPPFDTAVRPSVWKGCTRLLCPPCPKGGNPHICRSAALRRRIAVAFPALRRSYPGQLAGAYGGGVRPKQRSADAEKYGAQRVGQELSVGHDVRHGCIYH